MGPPLRALVLLLPALAASAGCATVAAPPSALMQKVGRSDLRPEELRIRVRAMAPRFSGQMEVLADEVARQEGDVATRQAMTRFKVNAIPALQAALFQPDPVAALLDAWALVAQLQDALVRSEAYAPPVVALARPRFDAMEQELAALWGELTGREDTSRTRAQVHRWADVHPIQGSVAARTSTTEMLSHLTAQAGLGALGTAGQLMETTQDLSARLDLQTAFLPKQARWQAESFVLDAMTDPVYRSALPELPALMAALQAVTEQVQALPWLMAREREAVLGSVRDERLGAQSFVTGEREALLAQLQTERQALLAGVDQTVQRGVDRAFDRAQRLVDRMFLWLGGLLLLGALAALLLVRTWRVHGAPRVLGTRREAHG